MNTSIDRLTARDARRDRLYFAQVREDPALEIRALRPTGADTIVVVSSGGCTALSLLAAGAGRVFAVDLNATQNHLVELKARAVARLSPGEAVRFLGGAWARASDRTEIYLRLRAELSRAAQAYWNTHLRAIRRGVIDAGVTESLIARIVRAIRLAVHAPSRIARLLACRGLEEQREFYAREWNSRRWRALFSILLNRAVFNRTYNPAFFRHVGNIDFARHFYRLAEHTLTELPVRNNYFLHQMLTGFYPTGAPDGLPLYLSEAGAGRISSTRDRLTLVDGSYENFLRSRPARSVSGFALSNICEWLSPDEIDALFGEIARTAAPGARLCFRNFVGWTEVPARWRKVIVEDPEQGAALIRTDRSMMQSRLAVCAVEGELS